MAEFIDWIEGITVLELSQLVKALEDRPRPLDLLVAERLLIPAFPKNLESIYQEWEARMLKQHLDRLIETGRVTVSGDGFRAA